MPAAPRPSIARVYDYWLGGTSYYPADQALGDRIAGALPAVRFGVQAQRALLGRVVRYLAGEAGIRQLLDIGSGLPTSSNVHQIAQRLEPATRVIYVDHDPDVLAQARAILATDPAAASSAAGPRSRPCSAGWSWYHPAWSWSPSGIPARTPRPPATTRFSAWPAPGWPGNADGQSPAVASRGRFLGRGVPGGPLRGSAAR